MIEAAAKQIGEALSARGVDPSAFLSDGVEAARTLAGADEPGGIEVLALLEHFARQLADRGIAFWTPFRFGVRPIATVASHDHLLFASLLSDLWRLLDALTQNRIEIELVVQQGVAVAVRAENAAEVLGPLLRMSARLASKGIDPKEVLRHGASFGSSIEAVESFVLSIRESGVLPYFPIMSGVAAIAEAMSSDRHGFADALTDLSSTIASMMLAGLSPYPILEFGVSSAFRASAHASWLASEILPLAGAIAAHGKSPLEALARGVPALAGLDEQTALSVLLVAEKAAEEGIDPAPVLHSFVPVIPPSDPDTVSRLTEDACALIGAAPDRTHLTFDEGFGQLYGRATVPLLERALRIGRAIAEHGIHPGPAIKYGVVSAVVRFEAEPVLLEAILDAAEREAIDGIDPWALLEWGTAAIASVAGDEAERLDLLGRLDSLVRTLAELGADARAVLLYTVHQPARHSRQAKRAASEASGDGREGFARAGPTDRSLVVGLVDRIAGAIAVLAQNGIDPRDTMVHGIPRAAEAAPHALPQVFRLIEVLAAGRVDPSPLLTTALPALASLDLDPLIDRLALVSRHPHAVEAIAAIGRAANDRAYVVLPSLDLIARMTWNGAPAVAAIACEIASSSEQTFGRLIAVVEHALAEQLPIDGLSHVARAANGRPEVLAELLAIWRRYTERRAEGSRQLAWAAMAAAEVASDPSAFERVLDRFAESSAAADPERSELVFRASLGAIAKVAERDEQMFASLLDALLRLAATPGLLDELLENAMPIAHRACRDADSLLGAIEDLIRLRTSGAIARVEREVWRTVARLRDIVEREPRAFAELILPTIRAQGAGSPAVLAGYARLGRAIDALSIPLLRAIATQQGVRAPELIGGFLAESLAAGSIRSLGEEEERVLDFLRDVPIPHPEYYRRYSEITSDDAKSAAEKREQIDTLHAGASALVAAIVGGEVSEQQAGDPLFADALYYVFPPAYTAQRRSYQALFHALADHPEHTAARPAIERTQSDLPTGGYGLREGAAIDRAAWQPLLSAVIAVHQGEVAEVGDLGGALVEAWIEGKIGQAETKADLLRRIYLNHRITRNQLPEDLGEAANLIEHREFLADTTKEIIQDALRALRNADPEQYRERVKRKLSRRARVGTGLVRAVWRTIAAHREGTIDAETAVERLARQLKGFDLSSEQVRLRLLAVDREDLEQLIEQLERSNQEVELGEEHLRVLSDLVGSEMAAMARELEGKLEYRRSEGRSISICFEVTKRKAHVAIGYCEGVCTAADDRLWDDPRFFQTIFWGPADRACGGMHLLVIEVSGERHLALPGINPSMSLLAEVGADTLLDAIFAFARQIKERWQLASILIPTHTGIATNRGPIREVLEARGYPVRAFAPIQFSYRPYAYTFDRAFEIV